MIQKIAFRLLVVCLLLQTSLAGFSQPDDKFQHINLLPAAPATSPGITGYNLLFDNEFNGTLDPVWKCEYNWCNAPPGSSYYNKQENLSYGTEIQTPNPNLDGVVPGWTMLRIKTDRAPLGYNPTAPPHTYNYVTKYFTTGMLYSGDIPGNSSSRSFTYGFFEMRCKNPKAQDMYPAFWLFAGGNSHSAYNEFDIFEFAVTDEIWMTNWFKDPNSTSPYASGHCSKILAMPGQTFGDRWVTYSLKWYPNKAIYYINNIPVKIVADFDNPMSGTSIIPNAQMVILANSGNDERTPFTSYLPASFPNYMNIDYLRVYQRPDYSIPEVSYTVNGMRSTSQASPITIPYSGQKITFNGSETYLPNNMTPPNGQGLLLTVFPADGPGPMAQGYLNQQDLYYIDLSAFYSSHTGTSLQVNTTYVIALGGGSYEVTQFFRLVPYGSTGTQPLSFTINGQNNAAHSPILIPYNYGKPRMIFDGSTADGSSCPYSLRVLRCYSNGTPDPGYPDMHYETGSWYGQNALINIDLEARCLGDLTFTPGAYYRIDFIDRYGHGTWQVIYINPCTNSSSFLLNGSSGSTIEIENGDEIILDGSASMCCSNQYTVSVQQCDVNGTVWGNIAQKTNNYVTIQPAPAWPYPEFIYNISRIDIRDLCRTWPPLGIDCDDYFKVTFSTGSSSSSKLFHIKPCAAVNNTYYINGSNNSPYYIPTWINPYTNAPDPLNLYVPPVGMACNTMYFVSVQQMVNGQLVAPEAMAWLPQEDVLSTDNTGLFDLTHTGLFDVIKFAQDHGLTLHNNATYRIKLVAGVGTDPTSCVANAWDENNKLVIIGSGSSAEDNQASPSKPVQTEIPDAIQVSVYPNPAQNVLNVEIAGSDQQGIIQLYSDMGAQVKSLSTSGSKSKLDISDLPVGFYIVNTVVSGKSFTNKLQISR